MVTKGERSIGRTIRKLENTTEFSARETQARQAARKYREEAQRATDWPNDSPVQNLRGLLTRRKDHE